MKRSYISRNTIRRMPRYYHKVKELIEVGVERISSSELGRIMGLTPSQIRQDFSCFGEFGQQGYGYKLDVLQQEIAGVLGINRGFKAILIGVGHIGGALLRNLDFSSYGVEVIGAFDSSEERIGQSIKNITVLPEQELAEFCAVHKPDIAILCVPKEAAQKVSDFVLKCDIKAIWNYTNAVLDVHHLDVVTEDINFGDSLLTLSYMLAELYDEKKRQESKKESHRIA